MARLAGSGKDPCPAGRSLNPMRILIIEDDAFLRAAYNVVLLQRGMEVCMAHDGELGLTMAKVGRPDAILLDIVLPKLSGGEVLLNLKADPLTRDIPVLVFSNYCTEQECRTLVAAGAVACLPKTRTSLHELGSRLAALSQASVSGPNSRRL
jgi:DNA-binding response OmpR family regulator